MGMNSIERGEQRQLDHHSETHRSPQSRAHRRLPVEGAAEAAAAVPDAAPGGDAGPGFAGGGGRGGGLPVGLYTTVLHDPKFRDPRGYILPADQPDFATATKFVNTLIKNGITVLKATRRIQRKR